MRLDIYLFENRFSPSRAKAQEIIKKGLVLINGKVITKPSFELLCNENITITEYHQYVSRGAYKLLKALQEFDIDFNGKTVLDCGASTGGFSEVALENGAKKVYAVDVGRGELSEKLRKDRRVINLENTDVRNLTKEMVGDSDIVVSDISFISLRHILPKLKELLGKIEMVILFKPQFECGKDIAKRYKGVIKNSAIHKSLLKDFIDYLAGLEFKVSGLTYSSIQGKSGNIEYLFHLNGRQGKPFSVDEVVDNAFKYFSDN